MALDLDLDVRSVEPDGERVRPARVRDPPAPRSGSGACSAAFSSRSEVTVEVDLGRDLVRVVGIRPVAAPSCRRVAGSGSQTVASSAPGSTAIARYSEAIATQSSVSAITAGLQAIGSRSTAKPSAVPTANV